MASESQISNANHAQRKSQARFARRQIASTNVGDNDYVNLFFHKLIPGGNRV